ncbi:7131_t:CDS:1, partial [Entrophospora sp. SA101]
KARDPVWNYFNAIEIPHDSHLSAQCKFCFKSWKHGKPSELKVHLALKCPLVSKEVKLKYLRSIKSDYNTDSANKRQSGNIGNNMDLCSNFDSDRIDVPKISRANQAM